MWCKVNRVLARSRWLKEDNPIYALTITLVLKFVVAGPAAEVYSFRNQLCRRSKRLKKRRRLGGTS